MTLNNLVKGPLYVQKINISSSYSIKLNIEALLQPKVTRRNQMISFHTQKKIKTMHLEMQVFQESLHNKS